ncbi:MAG: 50S ribosomal protein L24 [candidate division WOR-3 bacterium]
MGFRIRKGDTIRVMRGRARGEEGKVTRVLREKRMLIAEGVNLLKKHQRPRGQNKPSGIIEIPGPVRLDCVALVCPKCKKPTKVGFAFDEAGKKFRVCKKCREAID